MKVLFAILSPKDNLETQQKYTQKRFVDVSSLKKGILPKMAETFSLRSYNKLSRCLL